MSSHLLKLNAAKTEFLVIHKKSQLELLRNKALIIGGQKIEQKTEARNIGVMLDSTLTMQPHVKKTARTVNMHLRNIGRARKYLTKGATESLI